MSISFIYVEFRGIAGGCSEAIALALLINSLPSLPKKKNAIASVKITMFISLTIADFGMQAT